MFATLLCTPKRTTNEKDPQQFIILMQNSFFLSCLHVHTRGFFRTTGICPIFKCERLCIFFHVVFIAGLWELSLPFIRVLVGAGTKCGRRFLDSNNRDSRGCGCAGLHSSGAESGHSARWKYTPAPRVSASAACNPWTTSHSATPRESAATTTNRTAAAAAARNGKPPNLPVITFFIGTSGRRAAKIIERSTTCSSTAKTAAAAACTTKEKQEKELFASHCSNSLHHLSLSFHFFARRRGRHNRPRQNHVQHLRRRRHQPRPLRRTLLLCLQGLLQEGHQRHHRQQKIKKQVRERQDFCTHYQRTE